MDSSPLVSIGLPVYNGENYLEEAIQSILGQTYTNFELIISDNASTDSTPEICQRYANLDPRIKYYLSNQNKGASWNYNNTFYLSKGKYFKWAAHDDMIKKDFLNECVTYLEENKDVILCYTYTYIKNSITNNNYTYINKDVITQNDPYNRIKEFVSKHGGYCNSIFGVIRSEVLKQTNLIIPYPHSDNLLLFHLALHGKIYQINRPDFIRRIHVNTSLNKNKDLSDLNKWYDTHSTKNKFDVDKKLLWEKIKIICKSNLKTQDKIKCTSHIILAYYKKNKVVKYIKYNLSKKMHIPA